MGPDSLWYTGLVVHDGNGGMSAAGLPGLYGVRGVVGLCTGSRCGVFALLWLRRVLRLWL